MAWFFLFQWLVGWLVGLIWLVGWLVGWLELWYQPLDYSMPKSVFFPQQLLGLSNNSCLIIIFGRSFKYPHQILIISLQIDLIDINLHIWLRYLSYFLMLVSNLRKFQCLHWILNSYTLLLRDTELLFYY